MFVQIEKTEGMKRDASKSGASFFCLCCLKDGKMGKMPENQEKNKKTMKKETYKPENIWKKHTKLTKRLRKCNGN